MHRENPCEKQEAMNKVLRHTDSGNHRKLNIYTTTIFLDDIYKTPKPPY